MESTRRGTGQFCPSLFSVEIVNPCKSEFIFGKMKDSSFLVAKDGKLAFALCHLSLISVLK